MSAASPQPFHYIPPSSSTLTLSCPGLLLSCAGLFASLLSLFSFGFLFLLASPPQEDLPLINTPVSGFLSPPSRFLMDLLLVLNWRRCPLFFPLSAAFDDRYKSLPLHPPLVRCQDIIPFVEYNTRALF